MDKSEKKANPNSVDNVKEAEEVLPAEEQDENEVSVIEGESSTQESKSKQNEIEMLKDQILRTMAEYDNFRKRIARERIELEPDITAKVITEFLPVLDNLERALQAECADANYKKGIEMIHSSFLETLKKLGTEEIDTTGEFNPVYHQAVQKVNDENFDSGKITQTFQKGYKIGEKIIRFAMVAVNE
ncbi:MAG: nucleotide exchange factor GrpE [Oscillospiraceae bacterium]|nr:nucleotide exchange factor GrpE [Oscillospiraceae bacterium]